MYEITIKKIEERAEMQRGKWAVIDKRPYTQKEKENAYGSFNPEGEVKEVMGYLEDEEVTVNTETEILKQVVEEIDLNAVIKAVNNIG